MIHRPLNTAHQRVQRLFTCHPQSKRAGGGVDKPSWRNYFEIHEAAAFFHQFSSDEQLKELADDIDKQQVILEPIHTASVPGKAKPFVIDGISRLDGAEKTGRQIIRENGAWMGMLSNSRSVIHHPGKTDKEIWSLVISLNLKRRHHTTGQLAEIADKLATGTRGGDRKSNQSAKMHFGRAPTVKQAAEMVGVSKRSVEQFRKVKKVAPENIAAIRAGTLRLAKAVRDAKPRKAKPPVDKLKPEYVWRRYGIFLNHWTHTERRAVEKILRERLCP
jgi:hypothetical protein